MDPCYLSRLPQLLLALQLPNSLLRSQAANRVFESLYNLRLLLPKPYHLLQQQGLSPKFR